MQSSQENPCTGVPWILTLQETFEVGYATIRSETLRVGHDAIQSGAFLLGYVAIRTSEVGVELVPIGVICVPNGVGFYTKQGSELCLSCREAIF